jgi:hypothetical protein
MTVVIVLVAIALVGAVIARMMWRQGTGERHSVRDYQHALETLRQVSGRTEEVSKATGSAPGTRRPVGGRTTPEPTPAKVRERREVRRAVSPEPEVQGTPARRRRATDAGRARSVAAVGTERDDPIGSDPGDGAVVNGRRLAQDDDAATHTGRDTSPRPMLVFEDAAPAPVLGGDGFRSSMPRYRDRARPWLPVTVALAAVLVAGIALAIVELSGGGNNAPRHLGHHAVTAPHHRTGTTTTTVTAPPQVQAAEFTAATATYRTAATTYTVVVTAQSGECWVQATNPNTGALVWQGLLAQGSRQTLQGSGPMEIELGAASAAAMTLDGVPVALPPGFHSPFLATFSPS